MTLDLNTNIDNALAGFRLANLEVFNWGTFHEAIWTITPNGKSALLTGGNGSGKSTLVDAITTLLVPNRKIVYNKAAGAEGRERSLQTYVQGAYRNEKIADTARARDVFLRPGAKSYSVLIANFRNEGTQEEVALAQVLWMSGTSVSRIYLLASNSLSVAADFSDFGGDINRLRRRLRQREDVDVHASFTNYADAFRRRFGIRQQEALELFYQTVSMKQVGNLTEFVRERMLGQTAIETQIATLLKSYADADAAHREVLSARRQLEVLTPLVEADWNRQKYLDRITELNNVRSEIPRYFAHQKITAHREELAGTLTAWQVNATERATIAKVIDDRSATLQRLRTALYANDIYVQLGPLETQITTTERELDERRRRAERYAHDVRKLDLTEARTPQDFATQRSNLQDRLTDAEADLATLTEAEGELYVAKAHARKELTEIENELRSLRERPTSIPRHNLELRERLLTGLSLDAQVLPFAGELLRVRKSAAEWEGAIERVLRGLGLSLLVPDRHYPAVSALVNRLHLNGRLVYLRTIAHRGPAAKASTTGHLPQKVRIKGDSEHYDWLQRELETRYNYECCETAEDLQRTTRGISRSGQVKSSRHRHEKDDRHRIDDRRRYVLGWANEAKVTALEEELRTIQGRLAESAGRLEEHRTRVRAQEEKRELLRDIIRDYPEFTPLNYAQSSQRLRELQVEYEELQSRSGEVTELQASIGEAERKLNDARAENDRLTKTMGHLESDCLRLSDKLYHLLESVGVTPPVPDIDSHNPDVPAIVAAYQRIEVSAHTASSILQKLLKTTSDPTERKLLKQLDGENGLIGRQESKLRTSERQIVRQMADFRKDFPDAARDVDAELEALPDYRRIHDRLTKDQLPKFEDRFRQLLKEDTIRNIVVFQTSLSKYENEIKEKIARINEHLRDIDYGDHSYIAITHEAMRSDDIAGFKRDLRDCLSGTLGDGNLYTEGKFQQVKKLLDRFRGDTEIDRRWTARVTDVRQWYEFGADERGRDDDQSRQFYSDSSGKSGGQKEKLAYTILASAIAFQFGLQAGRSTDRSFRFVMIDEAFARGSDQSTRYALQLFKRLHLQLLIVTPLQKINVIEDYVSSVHFVDNPGGNNSRVRNIGIEEYQREHAASKQ